MLLLLIQIALVAVLMSLRVTMVSLLMVGAATDRVLIMRVKIVVLGCGREGTGLA